MKGGWLVVVALLGCGTKQEAPAPAGSAASTPPPKPASGACAAATTPVQLAQGKLHLFSADNGGAYVTEDVAQGDRNITRLSRIDGKGTATQLASDPLSIAFVVPIGDFLYYRAMAQLKRVPKAGGSDASEVKITGVPLGDLIGGDASQLYFVRRDKGVYRAPLAGGAAEQAIKQYASAFDGKRFISLRDQKVEVITLDGAATTLATIPKGIFLELPLAFDGSYVYYATKEPGTNAHTGIQRVAAAGGDPQTIAPGEDAGLIGVGGGFVYWSIRRATTEVHRAPVGGGPVATVACLRTGGAIDLAATAGGVYFTDQTEDHKGTALLFSAAP